MTLRSDFEERSEMDRLTIKDRLRYELSGEQIVAIAFLCGVIGYVVGAVVQAVVFA